MREGNRATGRVAAGSRDTEGISDWLEHRNGRRLFGNETPHSGAAIEVIMDGTTTDTSSSSVAPLRYMSVRTCATYLDRTVKAIYHLVADGRIPYRKLPGGRIVFDRDAIDRWIAGAPGVGVGEARRAG